MNFFDIFLIFSILSCSLVTGFVFTYAVIVMPGLSTLDDREFIRAFQVTDKVIQKNQLFFMVKWIGSIISVLGVVLFSIVSLELRGDWLTIILILFIY